MRPTRTLQLLALALVLAASGPAAADGPFRYFPITPCRLEDTRVVGGPITFQTTRNFTVQGTCGVPPNAKAIMLNTIILGPTTDGYVTLYPSNVARPLAANLVFRAGEPALSNGAIMALAPSAPDLSAYVWLVSGSSHLVIDLGGFYCKVDEVGACIP